MSSRGPVFHVAAIPTEKLEEVLTRHGVPFTVERKCFGLIHYISIPHMDGRTAEKVNGEIEALENQAGSVVS